MKKNIEIDFFQFKSQIQKKSLKPNYLFYGEADYLQNFAIDSVRKYFLDKNHKVNFEYYYGESLVFERLVNSIKILPLGYEKQVVIIKNIEKIKTVYTDKLNILIKEQPFKNNDIYILLFTLDNKLSKNTPVGEINKNGLVIKLQKPKNYQAKQWIDLICKINNKEISSEAVFYLQKITDNNLSQIENELEKVFLYLESEPSKHKISLEHLLKTFYGSETNNIFEFVDAIGERKTVLAIKMLRYLKDNDNHPLILLSMIYRQIKLLLQIKICNDDYKKIKGELHLPLFIIDKMVKQSQNYSIGRLKNSYRFLLEAEKKLKTGYFDPVLILEQLIIRITK